MKKTSFILSLTASYPIIAAAYTPTISNENIRYHSYTVQEIDYSVYNNAWANNFLTPVFQYREDDGVHYYTFALPDLTRYKTSANTDVFSLTYTTNGSIEFTNFDPDNGTFSTQYYYVNLANTANRMTSPGSTITTDFIKNFWATSGGALYNANPDNVIDTITGNFIKNQTDEAAGAIYNAGTINTINGNFINNIAKYEGGAVYNDGHIGTINGDFVSNRSFHNDEGGAIYNNSNKTIGAINGNFINNYADLNGAAVWNDGVISALTGDFIRNLVYDYGAGIYNLGTVGDVTGDFIYNNAGNTGGAIYNEGTINNLTGKFIQNKAENWGGAIYNEGTIETLNADFSENWANIGGAIYNTGTIGALSGTFTHSRADNINAGAIYNSGAINFQGTTRFITSNDTITNDGTMSTIGGTLDAPTELYLRSVYGNGTLNLNGYTNAYLTSSGVLASGQLALNNINIGENATLYANATYITSNHLTNNGTLVLTDGTLMRYIYGDGVTVIDGSVESRMNMAQPVTINSGKSLRVALDNIKNTELTNNGMLWFNSDYAAHATLDRPVSTYGTNVGNDNHLFTDAAFIDQDFINDDQLYLIEDGTLLHRITGDGTILLSGNTITANADNIGNVVAYDGSVNGTLNLTGGTISHKIYAQMLINEGDTVYTPADYLGNVITNNGTIKLTGGTLGNNTYMSGTGNIEIDNGVNVTSNIGYGSINASIVDNGTLTLTSGPYAADIGSSNYYGNITGNGTLVIDGIMSIYGELPQNVTINSGKTLAADIEYINNTNLTNNGVLWFSNTNGGYSADTLDRPLSSYGNVRNRATLNVALEYLDQNLINTGSLYLTTGGTLGHNINRPSNDYNGYVIINEGVSLVANANQLRNNVTSNGSLTLTGGTVIDSMYGNITINDGTTVTVGESGYMNGYNITNNGEIRITNGGYLSGTIVGDGHILVDSGANMVVNDMDTVNNHSVINNGTLTLTYGTLTRPLTGDGDIIIGGLYVYSDVNMGQDTTITQYSALTISADNINGFELTNNGTLKLNGGTLTRALSTLGTVRNVGGLTIDPAYLDIDFTTDADLHLADGTLTHRIYNYNSNVLYIDNLVTANADLIYIPVGAGGTLNLTGGTLTRNVASNITINNGANVSAYAGYLENNIVNNGTLTLTGGPLWHPISGEGTIIIDGLVSINTDMIYQNFVINEGKVLDMSIANIENNNITNNGTLRFNGGNLAHGLTELSATGTIVNTGSLYSTLAFIDRDMTNSGNIYLTTGGTLEHTITGSGRIYLTGGGLTANADNIQNSIDNNSNSLYLTGGTITNSLFGNGMTYINGDVTSAVNLSGKVTVRTGNRLTVPATGVYTNNLTNYGTLVLTDGTLNRTIAGDGATIIDGDVVVGSTSITLPSNITVNSGKSLAATVNQINNASIDNQGTLWLTSGTLNKALSNYGNIGNQGTTYTNVNYIDQNLVNNGNLYITNSGTLNNAISGEGSLYIRNNQTLYANADNIQNTVSGEYGYYGTLNLIGGTLNGYINTNMRIDSGNTVSADAGLIGHSLVNQGTLNLTGGVLENTVSGSGNIVIANDATVYGFPQHFLNSIINNGTLNLYYGTLNHNISGNGTLLVENELASNAYLNTNVNISQDGRLTVSVDNIKDSNLTNNGTLVFSGGTLDRALSSYGNVTSAGALISDTALIDQDLISTGGLYLTTNGTLSNAISGGGYVYIKSGVTVSTNPVNIANSTFTYASNYNGTLNLTGGTVASMLVGNILINPGDTVYANAGYIYGSVTNNGTLNLTAGSLGGNISGNGNIVIDNGNTVWSNPYFLNTNVINNGTLRLSYGTLNTNISGDGNILVGEYVTTNVKLNQPTTIEQNGSLITTVNNIKDTDLINNGTVWFSGGTLDKEISNYGNAGIDISGTLYSTADYLDQEVTNDGVLKLTGGTLANSITGSGIMYIDGDVVSTTGINIATTVGTDKSLTISAGNIWTNSFTNNGTLNLTGGNLAHSVFGSGNIVIDGNVMSDVNMDQPTTINQGKSLTVSVDNIKDTDLTNNGKLWFSIGTLDKAISNYGDAGISGTFYTTANYLDQPVENNGNLTLTGGVLAHSVTGEGNIVIANNLTATANILQTTFVNSGVSLTTSADNIGTNTITNHGVLFLDGGTLNHIVTGNGHVTVIGDVISNVKLHQMTIINPNNSLTVSVNNIKDTTLYNNGTLWFSSGTLDKAISNYGNAGVSGTLTTTADYLNQTVVNNGQLALTGGTLGNSVTGTGSIVIPDDIAVSANANYIDNDVINNGLLAFTGGTLSRNVTGGGDITIASGQSLYSNADYIGNTVTNNGALVLNGGTLAKTVSGDGNTILYGTVFTDATNLNSAVTNNGVLTLTGGTLSRVVYGSGNINIAGDVVSNATIVRPIAIYQDMSLRTNADNIANAVTNDGTLTLTGGTLTETSSGNGNIVIDGNVISATRLYQNINILAEQSLTTNASNIYSANTDNNGTLVLTGGTLVRNITGDGKIRINNESEVSVHAQYIDNDIINNGILTLTGGELNNTVSGQGSIVINGPVLSNANITQDITINDGKSLTTSVDNIKNARLINDGLLLISGGTLDRSVSNYGNVGNIGELYTDANYINRDLTNNGTLHLTDGTLRSLVTGAGQIVIDGQIATNVDIAQDTIISLGKSLTTSVDHIANTNITNNGTLWFTEGLLTRNIGVYGNVGNIGTLYTNANYLDADFTNNGILHVMGGILSHNITGYGSIIVSNDLVANADLLGNSITNNGNLILDGGTLRSYIVGNGKTYINGDVTANVNISQDTTINGGKRLQVFADNINTDTLINNGALNITGGVISKPVRGNGQTVIAGNVVNHAQNYNTIDIADSGYLTTDGGLLLNNVTINNNGVLNITSGTLTQNVNGGNTIIATNAATSTTSISGLDLNGAWNINSNSAHAGDVTVNGVINMNLDQIFKDSNTYTGGKLFADSITLGANAELHLVLAANDLAKGESTGYLKLIESDSWAGNWRSILQNNNKYVMDINDADHTIKFTYLKSGTDIVQEQNASQNVYVVVIAWDQEHSSDNPLIQQIIEQLNYAAQYNNAEYIQILNSIAPTDSNVVTGTNRALNTAINNQVSDRLAFIGRNGGDSFDGVSIWAQALYNHSSQSGDTTFSGNTFGFSLGADKKINDNIILGLGYSVGKTAAKSGAHTIDALGHTVFAYGEFRPKTRFQNRGQTLSPLYLNTTLSYNTTHYTEDAAYGISSKYDTTAIGLNGNIGYNITNTWDLFAGARYLKLSQQDYTDSIGQTISVPDTDIITANFGAKYTGTNRNFAPNIHAAVLYDIKSSDRIAMVNTAHASYQIIGDEIKPFGIQSGVGFTGNIGDWNMTINYDIEWHPDFTSHTARAKAKYTF